jgi:hypothetical protein
MGSPILARMALRPIAYRGDKERRSFGEGSEIGPSRSDRSMPLRSKGRWSGKGFNPSPGLIDGRSRKCIFAPITGVNYFAASPLNGILLSRNDLHWCAQHNGCDRLGRRQHVLVAVQSRSASATDTPRSLTSLTATLVHREDERSARLGAAGAEVVVGDVLDLARKI